MVLFFYLRCVLVINISLVLAQQTCEVNYTLYNGQCYRFYKEPLSNYAEARQICLSDNSDLVSIHNAFENAYVQNKDKDGVLIGLEYYEDEDLYKWSDGSSLDYTNFDDNFIPYRDFCGYCAKLVKTKWTNAQCEDDKLEFVCKKKANDVIITPDFECPNASTVYLTAGMILSPGYPDLFDFDETTQQTGCYYRLAGKNGYLIKLKIDEYFMQEKDGAITIYKAWEEDKSNKVARMDSNFEGGEIVIDYNRVLLRLTNAAHGAFKITWTTLKGQNETAPYTCPESDMIYIAPNTIFSPGYPNQFGMPTGDDTSVECSYKLYANDENQIMLRIEDASFGGSGDYFGIYEGWDKTAENLVHYVESNCTGTEWIIPSNEALLVVHAASAASYKIKVTPFFCEDEWTYHDDFCYFWNVNQLYCYTDARAECVRRNSSLASILTQAEQEFVNNFTSEHWTWIALIKNGSWEWIDGNPLIYTNWANGNPISNTGADYVATVDGFWQNRGNCDNNRVLCKKIGHRIP